MLKATLFIIPLQLTILLLPAEEESAQILAKGQVAQVGEPIRAKHRDDTQPRRQS